MSMLEKLKSLLQEVNDKTSCEISEDMQRIRQEKQAFDEASYIIRPGIMLVEPEVKTLTLKRTYAFCSSSVDSQDFSSENPEYYCQAA